MYILLSRHHKRTYVGQTEDLAARVMAHNAEKVRTTQAYCPWELIHVEEFGTRGEAMRREKWYKGRSGRKRIVEILKRLEGRDSIWGSPSRRDGVGTDEVSSRP